MSEIEKARLALAHDLDEAAKSGALVDYSLAAASIEILVRAVITERVGQSRAIAREEIAAAADIPTPLSMADAERRKWQAGYVAAINALNRATDAEINQEAIAQRIEHPISNRQGGGSNPSGFTKQQEGGDPLARTAEHDKSPPAVEAPAAGDEAARRAYLEMTDNHPTMHSNRFSSWDELDEAERQQWRDKVRPSDTTVLARRLAEALKFLVARCEHQPTGPDHAAMLSTQGWKERKALSDAHDALIEARNAGLIE